MKTKYVKVPVSDKEVIVNYLDKQINKHMEYDCMPENESGSYFVSRTSISKIVDGLIPLVKSTFVKKKVLKNVPDHSEEMLSMLEECLEKLPINTDSQVAFCKKVEQLILKIKG
ncbi:hypothetical protein DSC47_10100 [Elizabethkingia miricola]|uniref:hypothetical protein n=1 Tax=Elizabethkingia bruuniana TaxID=1756149 RepID=UPI00099A95B6|nr:hypothetical protein [Elizabethkingia bruuniana]OPC66360.1 hypothetical protein BAY13_16615 [Elizabethkingia bruuniana]RBI91642.1 hypothetical protein DSC47_10100 [Elizabethkingia miricola]